jgi:hypothetical protein
MLIYLGDLDEGKLFSGAHGLSYPCFCFVGERSDLFACDVLNDLSFNGCFINKRRAYFDIITVNGE